MSLNVPSGSEGTPRMCPMKGVKIERPEVPRISLSWEKTATATTRVSET